MKINKISEIMPQENKWVLVYLNKDNWCSSDNKNVYWKVVQLVKGISKEERALLELSNNPKDVERSRIYCFGDEDGNNTVPYRWEEFGLGTYFGQEVEYWCELPDIDFVLNNK